MWLGTKAREEMARRTNVWKEKRGAGSGTYRRRGNGSWQLTVRDADGNRLTKTVKASNETEVKRMLRDFLASVRRDEVPKAKGKPTVAQVADMWLAHKIRIKRDLAEATIDNLERVGRLELDALVAPTQDPPVAGVAVRDDGALDVRAVVALPAKFAGLAPHPVELPTRVG